MSTQSLLILQAHSLRQNLPSLPFSHSCLCGHPFPYLTQVFPHCLAHSYLSLAPNVTLGHFSGPVFLLFVVCLSCPDVQSLLLLAPLDVPLLYPLFQNWRPWLLLQAFRGSLEHPGCLQRYSLPSAVAGRCGSAQWPMCFLLAVLETVSYWL